MDDKDILELYFQRCENAIKETDNKYGNYLRVISVNILKDIEDSKECVNDTYLHVWKVVPPQKPNVFKVFLGSITRTLSFDCYRKKHAAKRGGGQMNVLIDELAHALP